MELNRLNEQTLVAQSDLMAKRAFLAETESLKEPAAELGERLADIKAFLEKTATELSSQVVLDVVAPIVDEAGKQLTPGGTRRVLITQRTPTDQDFELQFFFVPENSDTFTDTEPVLLDVEQLAYIPSGAVMEVGFKEHSGIMCPPEWESADISAEKLRQYIDIYLPERTRQIEATHNSANLIYEALANSELNPWVLPKIAQISEELLKKEALQCDPEGEQCSFQEEKAPQEEVDRHIIQRLEAERSSYAKRLEVINASHPHWHWSEKRRLENRIYNIDVGIRAVKLARMPRDPRYEHRESKVEYIPKGMTPGMWG
jgi:hypothetical protein